MAFYHRIPRKYLWLIPAVFFALIGAFDIGADLWYHKLTPAGCLFNVALMLPLLFNRWFVNLLFGMTALLFSCYILFAVAYFLHLYFGGKPCRYMFDTFVIGPVMGLCCLLCSLSLIYVGSKQSNQIRSRSI